MDEPRGGKSKKDHPVRSARDTYTAFDRKMIFCKEARKKVHFEMATDVSFVGTIVSVDKYFIEIDDDFGLDPGDPDGLVWISKAMIVSARVV